jgi:hypothetical protein
VEAGVAMSETRKLYELFEQQTLRLDDQNDEELAERIRALMDFVWYKRLSPDDRRVLNARGLVERTGSIEWIFEEPAKLSAPKNIEPVHADVSLFLLKVA